MRRVSFVAATALFFLSFDLGAQRLDSKFSRDAIGEKTYPPAPRLTAQAQIAPAVILSDVAESAPEIVQSIRQWNDEGRTPAKNGFVRSTIDPIAVFLEPAAVMNAQSAFQGRGYVAATANGIAWSGSIQVRRAFELRLHLEQVSL